VSLTKSLVACQKARLLAALAFLNNDHRFDLHACCVGMKSSFRPNLVPARPLCPRSATWRFSFIVNLSNSASGCMLVVRAEARAVVSCCCIAIMTLARSLILPYNNFVLSYCSSYFSVSHSLASNPVRCRLSLRSSYLGVSARGLHNLANHLANVLGYHRGPLGLFHTRNLGCDSRSHLMFY